MRKHGYSKERLYTIWNTIIQRCTKPSNKLYKNYGGRGITVDESWLPPAEIGYVNFKRDVLAIAEGQGLPLETLQGEKRHPESSPHNRSRGANCPYTLDRKDNGLGYTPENVRWVSTQVQNWNTRRKGERELPRGVSWREHRGKYQAHVTIDGRYKSLGYSATLAGAIALRQEWDLSNGVTPCSET